MREIVIANMTGEEIKLKRNRLVAEFHPRGDGAYLTLRCGKEQEGRKSVPAQRPLILVED